MQQPPFKCKSVRLVVREIVATGEDAGYQIVDRGAGIARNALTNCIEREGELGAILGIHHATERMLLVGPTRLRRYRTGCRSRVSNESVIKVAACATNREHCEVRANRASAGGALCHELGDK